MKNALKDVQKHLMTATSYMILFVVPGGIFYALSIMMNGKAAVPTEGLALQINQIGAAGLALFIPALGGYIALPTKLVLDRALSELTWQKRLEQDF